MTIFLPNLPQPDEALRLLAHMYARWFMCVGLEEPEAGVYARLRDVFARASSQREAYAHLTGLAEEASRAHEDLAQWAYVLARKSLQAVIQAGGSASALIVGQTDGFRHVCVMCGKQEGSIERVRFFHLRDRRPLLAPEASGARRSSYTRCQLCQQPIHPRRLVLFVLAGAVKHPVGCSCGGCNRAGLATLLNIYAWEQETQRLVFPVLHQMVAPRRTRAFEQALTLCWEKGWYMLNKESILGNGARRCI
jgi:hypothetical protein